MFRTTGECVRHTTPILRRFLLFFVCTDNAGSEKIRFPEPPFGIGPPLILLLRSNNCRSTFTNDDVRSRLEHKTADVDFDVVVGLEEE